MQFSPSSLQNSVRVIFDGTIGVYMQAPISSNISPPTSCQSKQIPMDFLPAYAAFE